MATGSITHNVVIDTPEATEALVNAMEKAELEAYKKTGLTVSELDEQAYKIQTYNDLLAELKQYQSLGSVEELATIKKYHEISTPEDIKASRRLVELAEADKNTSVVPREAYEQVAWERDVAVKQLWDDYGVRLGQKKADAERPKNAEG